MNGGPLPGSNPKAAPLANVAVFLICADTEAKAQELRAAMDLSCCASARASAARSSRPKRQQPTSLQLKTRPTWLSTATA